MKRLFSVINIVLITALSFLSVDTAYKIFAAQLKPIARPKFAIPKKGSNPTEFKIPPLSNYKTILERNIFHSNTQSAAISEKTIIENIKPTERNLKLWGTVVGNDPASAYAIIEESGAKSRRRQQSLYRRGDIVQGAEIKKILREKVILSANGNNEILRIVKPQSSGRIQRTRSAYKQRSNRPIRQRRTLRRSQIQKALGNINTVMSQANIRPHSEGFQITRIRPTSIFRRLGLRNGDIITAVDDRPIQSVDDAMGIWQNLTARGETSIRLKRRGRTRIIEYRIR
jgi:general secretion pathway protein C